MTVKRLSVVGRDEWEILGVDDVTPKTDRMIVVLHARLACVTRERGENDLRRWEDRKRGFVAEDNPEVVFNLADGSVYTKGVLAPPFCSIIATAPAVNIASLADWRRKK